MATKTKVSAAGQGRVSAKVAHLVRGGEVPNTAEGRKKALGMAYGMEEAGRLGPRGAYRPVGKPKPAASRPYTPPSAARPRPVRPAPRPAPPPRTPTRPPGGELVQANTGAWSANPPRFAKGGVVKHSKAHPGFKAVQAEIAETVHPRVKGQSKKEAAGAILASRTRHASAAAHKANPRLSRVKG